MREKDSGKEAGVLLVDKPAGKSSFAMVRRVRKIVGIKKVGHAGTLDPFATGLLVICLGRPATRLVSALMEGEKEYLATLRLGAVSTTQDPEGVVSGTGAELLFSEQEIDSVFAGFTGPIMQKPPAFSALKHNGKPLYEYARRGIIVEKEPRPVTIYSIDWEDRRHIVDASLPELKIRVRCSKGTYLRTLAADIGDRLGCGAYLTGLRRTASGFFTVTESVRGEDLDAADARAIIAEAIISVEDVRNLLQ
ncbi:MAG: tRNA pseudouridine(55) synthase TruB [Proteobacteria bacterium]|nr:MAG: tRNA pseudouridine(55) synthase TruB [Pseudomonadota bacterium]